MALPNQTPSDNEKAARTYGPLALAIILALLTTYLLASNIKLNERVTIARDYAGGASRSSRPSG